MTKSDLELIALLDGHITTLDDIRVTIIPFGDGWRYRIHAALTEVMVVNRDKLADFYADGTLKFYKLANVGSELTSALWDWD